MGSAAIIGTAGWSVPQRVGEHFPALGSHLERYSAVFGGVEIDTSFYRHHKPETYAKWAAATPKDFQFAVKTPKSTTHTHALSPAGDDDMARFLDEIGELGEKLGTILVQLPPSLVFAPPASAFFSHLRRIFSGNIALEPRHRSWFTPTGARLLDDFALGRVGADPAIVPEAAVPAGPGIVYRRLHGSPHMYHSSYDHDYIRDLRQRLRDDERASWCIFDNTAAGFAAVNALEMLHHE